MIEMLRPLAVLAQRVGDHRVLGEVSYAALRLDQPQFAAELLFQSRKAAGKSEATDWRGEDIRDATLIVRVMESANQGVANGVGHVGRIAAAAKKAARTVIVVDPRMVALFARSLPEITVLPFGADLESFKSGKFVTANANDIELGVGNDTETIRSNFRPVLADAARSRALRDKYRHGRELPLIGISWWSSHYGKDLPAPDHWARLVREIPAQFVSLQYGDVAGDIARFNAGNPSAVIDDPEVDQLRDMDAFASQIDAMDLVVTISNSGAHLASALGKPVILVRDDLFRRIWPYLSRAVPWYPETLVIGKDGRPWDKVFDEIISTAKDLVGAPKRN